MPHYTRYYVDVKFPSEEGDRALPPRAEHLLASALQKVAELATMEATDTKAQSRVSVSWETRIFKG